MARPSLATVVVVLVVGMLGAMAVALVERSRVVGRRSQEPAAVAPPVARIPSSPRRLQPIRHFAPRPRGYEVLRPRHPVALRSRPDGRAVTTVATTTQFGSPTTLTVAARHGSWVGVTSTQLPNGTLGWVRARPATFAERRTRLAIRVSLSHRRLQLVRGDRVLRTITVGIGRPGSPTPHGRFSVTDKIPGTRYGPYYGCCILALSGHQTHTPAGWSGGDRLAIHGTNDPSSVGVPSSLGCLHASAGDLEALMRRVTLGTPVFVRS